MTIHTVTVNPALDVSAEAPRVVAGEKIRCERPRSDPGGGGVNVSRVITRMGGDTLAHLTHGGAIGEELLRLLHEEHVPTRPVAIANQTRQSMTVRALDTGEEYRFVLPGPAITPAELHSLQDAVVSSAQPGDVVVLSGSLAPGVPDSFYAEFAAALADREIRVAVDSSGLALERALRQGVWLVKPSRRELCEQIGRDVSTPTEVAQAARELVRSQASDIVAVSLGEHGAVCVSAEGAWHASAPRVVAKSAVGAGDSFLALLLISLDTGQPLERALSQAIAAGAATAMTEGTALCQPEVIERLSKQVEVTSL